MSERLPPLVLTPVLWGAPWVFVDGLEFADRVRIEISPHPSFPAGNRVETPWFVPAGSVVAIPVQLPDAPGHHVRAVLLTVDDERLDSPPVVVEPFDHGLIPELRPRVQRGLRHGAPVVMVSGAAPGFRVEVSQVGAGVLGAAVARPDGSAEVRVEPPVQGLVGLGGVTAWFESPSGFRSGSAVPTEVLEPGLPPLCHPAFVGQPVLVSNAVPDTTVVVSHQTHRFGHAEQEARVNVAVAADGTASTRALDGELGRTLDGEPVVFPSPVNLSDMGHGETLFAQQLGEAARTEATVMPRRGARDPVSQLVRLAYEGQVVLHLTERPATPSLLVHVERVAGPQLVATRPTPFDGRLALDRPLAAGDRVQLGLFHELWLTAEGQPEALGRPRVIATVRNALTSAPVWGVPAGGAAVRVRGVEAGADVHVYQDGSFIGRAVATEGTSAEVPVLTLIAGAVVEAEQRIGTRTSGRSAQVPVVQAATGTPPRIVMPAAVGDTRIRVAAVPPGSRVVVRTTEGYVLGDGVAADAIATLRVLPLPDRPLRATAGPLTAAPVRPIPPPSAALPPGVQDPSYAHVREEIFILPDTDVFLPEVGGLVTLPVRGERYLPQEVPGVPPEPAPPLVVILHGDGRGNEVRNDLGEPVLQEGIPDPLEAAFMIDPFGTQNNSALGYRYLGRTLARQGFHVYSLDCTEPFEIDGRAEDMLDFLPNDRSEFLVAAIERIRASDSGRYLNSRIGLVGHSLGGEAVILAQGKTSLAATVGNPVLPILAVAAIAPTSHNVPDGAGRPPSAALQGARLLLIAGSHDHFFEVVQQPHQQPLQHYLRGAGPRTLAFVHGANHTCFNSIWWYNPNEDAENPISNVFPPFDIPSRFQAVARDLIVSLMRAALLGGPLYEGYLVGAALLPRAQMGVGIRLHDDRTDSDSDWIVPPRGTIGDLYDLSDIGLTPADALRLSGGSLDADAVSVEDFGQGIATAVPPAKAEGRTWMPPAAFDELAALRDAPEVSFSLPASGRLGIDVFRASNAVLDIDTLLTMRTNLEATVVRDD